MISEILNELNNAITVIFGLNVEQSQYFIYLLSAIFIISWLAISAYLIANEPSLLEKWKFPNMGILSVIFLVGISAYIVSYMIVILLAFFSAFQDGTLSSPPLLITLIIMFSYIVIALQNTEVRSELEQTEYLPRSISKFIPQSLKLSFALLLFNLALYYTHDALSTGIVTPIAGISKFQTWLGVLVFTAIGVLMIIMTYSPKKSKKIKEWVEKYSKKSKEIKFIRIPLLFWILIIFIFIILLVEYWGMIVGWIIYLFKAAIKR